LSGGIPCCLVKAGPSTFHSINRTDAAIRLYQDSQAHHALYSSSLGESWINRLALFQYVCRSNFWWNLHLFWYRRKLLGLLGPKLRRNQNG
jgi:hypothetical protein